MPTFDFTKEGCFAEVVDYLWKTYWKINEPPNVPLLVFIDEIDAVASAEAMKGITTLLRTHYVDRRILSLVAGNISNLFKAGIRLSAGTHFAFWLQPFSSFEIRSEVLLDSHLCIEPLRIENVCDSECKLISKVWINVLTCYSYFLHFLLVSLIVD